MENKFCLSAKCLSELPDDFIDCKMSNIYFRLKYEVQSVNCSNKLSRRFNLTGLTSTYDAGKPRRQQRLQESCYSDSSRFDLQREK